MSHIFRQPLIHFLAIGACLLGAYTLLSDPLATNDGKRIVVNNDRLAVYLQFRNKRFSKNQAEQALAGLTEEERQSLIHDFITEEVLVKEANNLGLANDDFVIRQRLLQKMHFLNQGFVNQSQKIDELALEQYFNAHQADYAKPAVLTFSHLYWSPAKDNNVQINTLTTLRDTLNADMTDPTAAAHIGELFVFNRHYTQRTADHVAGHFGDDFVLAIKQQQTQHGSWIGPIKSAHGWHLVYLNAFNDAYIPELDDVRPLVTQDALAAASQHRADELIANIVSQYEIIQSEDAQGNEVVQ